MLLVLVIHFVSSVSSAPGTRYYRRSAQNTDVTDVEVLEQIAQETAVGESERLTSSRVQNSDFSAAIANVLAAAGAGPQPVAGGVSYGKRSVEDALFRADMESFRNKRSAQSAAEDVEVIDEAAVASSEDTERLRDANFNAAIANVLAVAGATPRAVSGGVSYGKRSAQTNAEDVDVEVIDETAVNTNTESEQVRSAGFNAAIAKVLKVAGASAQPVAGGVSYGKRSAMDKGASLFREDVKTHQGYGKRSLRPKRAPQDLAGPEHEAELEDPEAHPSGVPASVIAQVLKAAGAKPQPVVKGDISYLGKREAQEAAVEAVLAEIPLAAVKISPHSSNGNIVQHFDGNSAYQNSVHVSRFGRARRSTEDNFIPFHVYDDRRVKTLKVEQNDFLALKPKTTEMREKRNNQQETNTKNHT